jgi:hypothetical protein
LFGTEEEEEPIKGSDLLRISLLVDELREKNSEKTILKAIMPRTAYFRIKWKKAMKELIAE